MTGDELDAEFPCLLTAEVTIRDLAAIIALVPRSGYHPVTPASPALMLSVLPSDAGDSFPPPRGGEKRADAVRSSSTGVELARRTHEPSECEKAPAMRGGLPPNVVSRSESLVRVLHKDGVSFRRLNPALHACFSFQVPGRGSKTVTGGHQFERRPSASQPAVAAPASYALCRKSSRVSRGSGEVLTSS
jgi:hypothetical protein